mgnify:FL=1
MNQRTLVLLAVLTAAGAPLPGCSTTRAKVPADVLGDNESLSSPADSSRVYDIDEVVVVDQPKENLRLRQQPLSSSSFSALSIQNYNSQDLRQLSAYVPAFTMPDYGSRYTSSMYIRGIGSRVNSPAVGVYVDGMPLLSKSALNFHTYGLERIDVLRGPQGSLYGMNTEGGLVRMFTRNPFNYQGTYVDLSVGSAFWRKAEVSHFRRLSDKFAFSLAGFYDGQNGFFRNDYNGDRADEFNEFGFRGHSSWRPAAGWSVDLMADYQYVNQNGFPYGRLLTKEEVTSAPITSELYGRKAGTQHPSQNRQSTYRRNLLNTGLGVKYDGRGFVFNSMTTWQFLHDDMLMDIDYLPADYMHMTQRQLENSVSEELSVKSRNNSFWHWTFGAFASYQWLRTDANVYFDPDMNTMVSRRMQSAIPIPAVINMDMGYVPGLFHTPTADLGIYHESNINITPKFTLTLGARYDFSHVKIDYLTSSSVSTSAEVMGIKASSVISSMLNNSRKDSYRQFLPKAALTYKLENGSNIYAVWSKGYRAGGYNFQMFSDILQSEINSQAKTARGNVTIDHDAADYDRIAKTIQYKPETSWNYEIGTHLNLFNGLIHLDVATFYMQIRNQQLSVMAGNYGFGRIMTNAGRSHSTGMEMTLRGAAASDHLNYTLSYSFTSAEFDKYRDSTSTGEVVDYKNKHVPFVPQHTLAAAADYKVDVDPAALLQPSCRWALRSVTFGANLSCQGQTWWTEANDIKQRFYAVVGVHAAGDFGPLGINVWIKNLTDTKFNTFAVQSSATGNKYTFAQRGNPFQIGVDFKYKF